MSSNNFENVSFANFFMISRVFSMRELKTRDFKPFFFRVTACWKMTKRNFFDALIFASSVKSWFGMT